MKAGISLACDASRQLRFRLVVPTGPMPTGLGRTKVTLWCFFVDPALVRIRMFGQSEAKEALEAADK